ncbi:hypothetical protein OF83DRAFT_1207829 [Amylostereum chailletii]|nr:hypothetical protein OF83DRAFT_1207829 [Amylostereum chailletii]
MTVLFRNIRIYFYIAIFLLSGAVLGLSAYFASVFLPEIKRNGFTIYSLVVPSFTILVFFILLFYSEPRIEVFFLFVTGALWLGTSSLTPSRDITPATECFALAGQTVSTSKKPISARSFCYESTIVEAFSWTTFLLLAIFFVFVIAMAARSRAMGRIDIWREPIIDLPWFGQAPGYPGEAYYGPSFAQYYGYGAYPQRYPGSPATVSIGGQVIHQQPGHSIVIRPGLNGEAPQITQVPGMVHNI